MKNTLQELIDEIEEIHNLGSIGYSSYKKLISLARRIQVENK